MWLRARAVFEANWTATQAAWRFLNNKRVSLQALVEPLREAGRLELADEQQADDPPPCALLVHDWSKIDFPIK